MALISTLDHLVLVCDSLAQGIDYCDQMLGVRPLKGGRHVRMATHNHLLNLGHGVYLEVIAQDPDAPLPPHPRWFGMGRPGMTASAPRLTTFVARTNRIAAAAAALPALGPVCDMQRDTLSWQITIRPDGQLFDEGTVPALIQWPDGVDPTASMPDLGCRFVRLEAFHPQPAQLRTAWNQIGLAQTDTMLIRQASPNDPAHLVACIDTPQGRKMLNGHC